MNPLEQLRDMHTPPAPGWWPPAPGWWVLTALLIVVLVAGLCWAVNRHRRSRYRREALAALHGECARSPRPTLEALQLVRRTARTADSTSDCPSLPSSELLRRLDAFDKGRLSRALTARGEDLDSFSRALYRPDPETDEAIERAVFASVRHWIRRHPGRRPC